MGTMIAIAPLDEALTFARARTQVSPRLLAVLSHAGDRLSCADIPANPLSGRGFTTGKSAPGYLPVGDLFVVPRNLDAFVGQVTLELSVNGERRQHAPAMEWIWDFDEILRQARAKAKTEWAHRGGVARLAFTAEGAVPARVLLMAGTPAGTVFQGVARGDYASGILDWLAGFGRRSLVRSVIERHIARVRAARIYLQPGDEVTIRVDRLGTLANRVARQD